VDYAHHPTEIAKAVSYIKKCNKKITLIFQPHTNSRTKNMFDDFVKVLSKVEEIYVYKTYEAIEKPKEGISGKELALGICKFNENCKYIDNLKDIKKILSQKLERDIIVIMGAGDLPEKLGFY
jgi:UDP-N-acetylmuramate--alanine ligase